MCLAVFSSPGNHSGFVSSAAIDALCPTTLIPKSETMVPLISLIKSLGPTKDPTLNPASPQFFDTEYAVIVFSGNKSAARWWSGAKSRYVISSITQIS